MSKKMSVKKILELDNSGMSGRDIAIILSNLRNSVAEVLALAQKFDLTWDKIKKRRKRRYITYSFLINLSPLWNMHLLIMNVYIVNLKELVWI